MQLEQNYTDVCPPPSSSVYIPKIFGFKIYKCRGSKYLEDTKKATEITYYGEEQLNKLRETIAG